MVMRSSKKAVSPRPALLAALAGTGLGVLAGVLLVPDRGKLAARSEVRSGTRPGARPADPYSATEEILVALDPQQAFLRAVPVPLPLIFQASHGLPAIASTSTVAPWDQVGLTRTVFFETGDTAQEEITAYQPGDYFAYRVSGFTFAAKYLAQYAIGQWWFVPENGSTRIVWRYTFVPQNALIRPLLALFVRLIWKGYMAEALRRVQHLANPGMPSTATPS